MTWSWFRASSAVLVLGLLTGPLAAQEIDQDELPENHLLFTLKGTEEGFQGACEHLPGFEVAIVVARDDETKELDMAGLMEAIREDRVSGDLTYPNGKATEIGFEIVEHRGRPEIYMKSRLGFAVWEQARVRPDALAFVIDFWYTPPAVEGDLEAVRLAMELLEDPADWLRSDDRNCESDQWSLFCALKHTSTKTLGQYNHHSKAMNEVREAIYEQSPGVQWAHVLMDYNNADTTTHDDILNVLQTAEVRIAEELVVVDQ